MKKVAHPLRSLILLNLVLLVLLSSTIQAISPADKKNIATFTDTGQYDKARKYIRREIRNLRGKYGRDDIQVAQLQQTLGALYIKQGLYDNAISALQEALRLQKSLLGTEHTTISDTLDYLGSVYFNINDFNGAKTFYERALQIRIRAFGEDHIDCAQSYYNLAKVLIKLNDYEMAIKSLDRCYDIRERYLPPDHNHIQAIHDLKVDLYMRNLEYKNAEDQLHLSLKTVEKFQGTFNVKVARLLLRLGKIQLIQNSLYRSSKSIKRAISILTRIGGQERLLSDAHHLLGEYYVQSREYAYAQRNFQIALTLRKNSYGKNAFETTQSQKLLNAVEGKLALK